MIIEKTIGKKLRQEKAKAQTANDKNKTKNNIFCYNKNNYTKNKIK